MYKGVKQAWLSPSGKFIISSETVDQDTENSYHNVLGLCIIKELESLNSSDDALKFIVKNNTLSATEYLEGIRWIRLHKWDTKHSFWINNGVSLTPVQESVILDWCIENNVKFSTCIL